MTGSFSQALHEIADLPDIKKYRTVEGGCGPLALLASCELLDKGFYDFTVHHRYGYIQNGIERGHFFIERNLMVFDFSAAQFGLEGNPHVTSLHTYENMFPIAVNKYKVTSKEELDILKENALGYLLN